MRLRSTALVLALLALALTAFACTSDDGDGEGNGDEPDATEAMENDTPVDGEPDTGDVPSGGGTATLTVGDETYNFDGYLCAFGPEETRNPNVEFSSTAFGESATGARTQLSVDITLGIHAVTLDDVDDFENPSVSLSGVVDGEIQIDGKNISAEATFDDGTTPDVFEETPGTFSGTCP
jgi:hypothetical protein